MIPLFVDPSRIRILVIGGGRIALRKCRHFYGSRITVISRSILPEISEIAEKTIIGDSEEKISELMDGSDIIIAATDDKELNSRIVSSALSKGKYVNSAHGGGNILIPSVLEKERYTIAVSSRGNAPAFPPFIVKELDIALGEEYDRMLDLMIEMRDVVKSDIPDPEARKRIMGEIVNDRTILTLLSDGDLAGARELASKKVTS
ncbi:MAG: bifunctional precorrin-2 dehydrogenase/sirohydrochlorin ferrochelatase [Candidatus Methanoplasma sp.]|jgi:siroheme synthase-like protein|nr:bifunctional precorrin-2 dehydrogenase/sirohydrochlorin ferrochelatase [Candidatus Methanoplasma sp.]